MTKLTQRALFLFLVAACVAADDTARAVPITDLFNTGVDNSGTPLPGDVDDPHYALIVDPSGLGDATIPADGFPIPPWIANNAISAWIGPDNMDGANDGNGPGGNYSYRTTFTLPGDALPATASIAGQWAVDNTGVDILLNGIPTGNTNVTGFTAFTPFTIPQGSPFQFGTNTLDFIVNNGSGPTGLRVEMTGEFNLVPEPSSLVLAMFAVGGVIGWRRRQQRRHLNR